MKSAMLGDCPQVLRDFLYYMETILNRSPNTVHGYYTDIRSFLRFMKLHKNKVSSDTPLQEITIADITIDFIEQITTTDIYEFLYYVSSDLDNKPAARLRKISCLKSFYKYMTQKAHLFEYNPMSEIDRPNKPKRIVKYLTIEQAVELLNTVSGPYKERDYCILTLLLNCGLRLSEIVGLNENDIKEDSLVVTGKGDKQRMVYLNAACINAIADYRKYKREHYEKLLKHEKAFFISRNQRRINKRSVEMIVEKYLKAAHLDNMGFSTHKLRHTAATLMYQHGNVDVRTLQEILGHESLSTTQIYTHVSNQQTKSAIESNPLASFTSKKDS